MDIVDAATKRTLRPAEYNFAPVIIGVDPAWTGSDQFVIIMRQGLYSKVLGEYQKNDNDGAMAAILAGFEDEYKADAVFIDQGYGTGLYSFGVTMGRSWKLVAFGGKSGTKGFANKRAEIWGKMKDWLINGGVLPDDDVLRDDLIGPEASVNEKGEIILESKDHMKARGVPSPNKADALALTFSLPVLKSQRQQTAAQTKYNPFRKG